MTKMAVRPLSDMVIDIRLVRIDVLLICIKMFNRSGLNLLMKVKIVLRYQKNFKCPDMGLYESIHRMENEERWWDM